MKFTPSINLLNYLSYVDYLVFFAILALTFLAVIYGVVASRKSEKNGFLDYMLMGRALTLPMFIATLVATWYGGIFGVTEMSFKYGIYNFVTQGFFWYLTYIIFALYLVKKVKASEAVTLPELIGTNFGPRSQKIAAVFNFFNVVPIVYVISIGLLCKAAFGCSLAVGTVLGTGFVCLYSLIGGFRAVVFSDLVQFFVMCSSVLLVLIFSFFDFGGVGFLQERLEPRYFDITGGHSVSTLLVWGLIALSTLVDPNFYQRCFAAKDDKTAKFGIFAATGVWFVFDICTTLGGMYAAAVIPEAKANEAYLAYAIQILPAGLKGFFLAGILATVLSTIDSYNFIAANTLSYDFVPKKFKHNLLLQKISILFTGLIAVTMALCFEGSIKSVWKTLGSYSAGCLLFPVMVGYAFPGKISDRVFSCAVLVAAAGITYWRFSTHTGFWAEVDDLYIGVVTSALVLALGNFIEGNGHSKSLSR